MKEILVRSFSGLLYVSLLVFSLYNKHVFILLFFLFGLICLAELKKLIQYKSLVPFIVFTVLYGVFGYWQFVMKSNDGLIEATQILQVITIFVQLFLIKDLFTEKNIPLFISKKIIITTFYLSSGFVFLVLIANYHQTFSPLIILGAFILVWTNDTFAYLVGKILANKNCFQASLQKKQLRDF